MEKIKQILSSEKIVAIVRNVPNEKIEQTVKALLEGGIKAIEITLDQSSEMAIQNSVDNIKRIKHSYGDEIYLGAGTVLSIDQANDVMKAGVSYIISPHTDPELIKYCKSNGIVSIPGALTPSEIVLAYEAGADFVKVFPSGVFGINYLKAVKAPLNHIPMVAVGGVNLENIQDFIKEDFLIGIGGNLVDKRTIDKGDFETITKIASAYVEKVKSL